MTHEHHGPQHTHTLLVPGGNDAKTDDESDKSLTALLARVEQHAKKAKGKMPTVPERGANVAHKPLTETRAPSGSVSANHDAATPTSLALTTACHALTPIDPATSPTIRKANILVEARYSLTLAEHRLLLCVLALINSHPTAAPITATTRFDVTAGEMSALIGIPINECYKIMRNGLGRLADRWITITVADASDPDTPSEIQIKWVYRKYFFARRGRVGLCLSPDIIPYVTRLSREYTEYRLCYAARLTTEHSIRLYELLLQWKRRGDREIEVGWLRSLLMLDDKYPKIAEFKRRIIDPSIEKINAVSDLKVRYSEKKHGRHIVALCFEFEYTEALRPPRYLTNKQISEQALPGETFPQAKERLNSST